MIAGIHPGQVWLRRGAGDAVVVTGVTGWKVVYRGQRLSSSHYTKFLTRFFPVIGDSGEAAMRAGDLIGLLESRPDEVLMVRTREDGPLFILDYAEKDSAGTVDIHMGECVIGRPGLGNGIERLVSSHEVTVLRGALVAA